MPCVGIEPTIPASERAKTVHAINLSATVTDRLIHYTNTKFVIIHYMKYRVSIEELHIMLSSLFILTLVLHFMM
jgi:hypothetical protein